MRIAMAGTGYVGLVTAVCLAHHGHEVTCVDIDENKIQTMRAGISPIYEEGLEELMAESAERLTYTTDYRSAYQNKDVIFIGVGTPEKKDGSANLDFIYAVCKQIAESVNQDTLVVVKSTVPIGTNDDVEKYLQDNVQGDYKISVASNPEFLSQGTAVRDTLHGERIVIGAENEEDKNTMLKVYENFGIPMLTMNRRSAEMVKYASNDFLALKISYINEIANLCESLHANIEDVTRG
ncbi:MAG: UDP-glucose/GDP-mannose dehydrogenase family protein, partial [Erysipelotrichales bacterium]|nr:UDP-glucose/GDP-mannose dehydrogenase family protein [Erysipelotrichales bacterium]